MKKQVRVARNPTNAVGGLFTLNLQIEPAHLGVESHQLRWWDSGKGEGVSM
jgi:hypothetical protein